MSTNRLNYGIDADPLKLYINLLYMNKTIITVRAVQTVPINIDKDAEYNPSKIEHKVVIDSYQDKYDYDKIFEIYIENIDKEYFKDWENYNISKIKTLLTYSIVYFFLYTRFKCNLIDGIIIEENIRTVKQYFNDVEPEIKSLSISSKGINKILYSIYRQFKLTFSKYIKNFTEFYTNIENYLKLEVQSKITPLSNHIDDENAVIYCIGDLEGDLDMIYNWFVDKKFINEVGEWVAPPHVYVLQLGDQMDALSEKSEPSLYRRSRHPHLRTYDFEVVLFFEYLRYKSNNHVISVLGNHDWMQSPNYVLNFDESVRFGIDDRYKSRNDSLSSELFQPGGVMYSILMRRPFLVRINNVIGSHAGFSTNSYNSVVTYIRENELEYHDFDYIIDMINNKKNLVDVEYWYKNVVYPIIWNRDFENEKCINIDKISKGLSRLIPTTRQITGTEENMVIQQVIGHNTMEQVEVCKNSNEENVLIKVDTGYVSRQCSPKTSKTRMKYAVLQLRSDRMMYNIQQEEFEYDCGVGKKKILRPIIRFVDFM